MRNRKIAGTITGVCGLLIVVHMIWPTLGIDAVTVALVALAALPWLLPYLKSLELPGGVKIEFPETKAATDKIIALSPNEALPSPVKPPPLQSRKPPDFVGRAKTVDSAEQLKYVANQDPNLALVGFRIELEKRLRRIAESLQIDVSKMTLRGTVRELQAREVLPQRVANGIVELVALGNSAAHGVEVSPAASQWVMDVGPEILERLDALETEMSGRVDR